MIMIKNILFCVAKAKIDDPDGEFWLILLETDHLKELFGILRTMVGNDANLDIFQLISHLSGTTESQISWPNIPSGTAHLDSLNYPLCRMNQRDPRQRRPH
jgi:hypothetical protein